jgi:hypothetical protein
MQFPLLTPLIAPDESSGRLPIAQQTDRTLQIARRRTPWKINP